MAGICNCQCLMNFVKRLLIAGVQIVKISKCSEKIHPQEFRENIFQRCESISCSAYGILFCNHFLKKLIFPVLFIILLSLIYNSKRKKSLINVYAVSFQISAENFIFQASIVAIRHKKMKVESTDQIIQSKFLSIRNIRCLLLLLLLSLKNRNCKNC